MRDMSKFTFDKKILNKIVAENNAKLTKAF